MDDSLQQGEGEGRKCIEKKSVTSFINSLLHVYVTRLIEDIKRRAEC